MRPIARFAMAFLFLAAPAPGFAADDASRAQTAARDPNERVCEDIVVTGSRLAKSRFCGTRAEWEEKQKQDREVTDNAQRQAADPCHAVLTHTGAPNCG